MKHLLLILSLCFTVTYNFLVAQNYSDSLTLALSKHFEQSDLPGFAVAIVDEDGTLYQKGFGYADKQLKTGFKRSTVENLGSVSKTIVGLALVKAIEDGKLTMDTKINDILPFAVCNPYFKDTPILVRHLATHQSSILDTKHYGKTYIRDKEFGKQDHEHQDFLNFINGHEVLDLSTFLKNILYSKGKWYKKKNFLKAPPGTQKEYTNLNAALTAYIIELATGVSFKEYTSKKIFLPLGMNKTGWDGSSFQQDLATPYFPKGDVVPRYKLITFPDGGLYSNTQDLSLLLVEVIKAYTENSNFLSADFAKLLLPGDADTNRAFWGMGIKSRNIGHSGSDPGTQTDLHFNADSRIGRIILTNVNAEDNEKLWQQYKGIHEILAVFEGKISADLKIQ